MTTKQVVRLVKDHVWGPVGSVVFHCAVVALLLAWSGRQREPKVVAEFVVEPREPVEEVKLDKPLDPPREKFVAESLDRAADSPAFDPVAEAAAIPEAAAEVAAEVIGINGIDAELSASLAKMDMAALELPGILGRKMAPLGTRDAGPKSGTPSSKQATTDETSAAIHRALVWLKNNQAEDGSWGPNKVAMTGLALLTFLGCGETSGSKEFGLSVRRAIDWLAEHQRADGIFATGKQMGQPTVYEHAIGTYAMCEAYGMTRRPDLRAIMEKAAAVIVAGQQPGGLWDYEYKKGERWDTSVSGWQVQALKAALVNGAEVNGLSAAIARSAEGMKRAQATDSGLFGYSQPGQGKIGMTGVGALCLELAGLSGQPATRSGLAALRGTDCDWQKPAAWPLYTWYYITQALYHENAGSWTVWYRDLRRELPRNQNADGSWNSPTLSGNDNEESKHGPVYSTTLAALSLSAPYRYAPVSQSMHTERETKQRRPADEAPVEII